METTNKNVIKTIAKFDIKSSDRFGDILMPILFKKVQCALFLSIKDKSVELLIPPDNEKQKSLDFFLLLTELISLLRDLENKHLIYVIQQEEDFTAEFYYQAKKDYRKTQTDSVIRISDTCTLHIENDGRHSVYENGNQILIGIIGTAAIYNDLMHFLNAIIYPTAGLKQYINHGFKSEEIYISTKANKISKISIYVAIFITLFSPFISVLWSNRYGVSKIDEIQFQKIIRATMSRADSSFCTCKMPFLKHSNINLNTPAQ